MKVVEITVSCDTDGCDATVTVQADTLSAARAQLDHAGWPQTRGLTDHCPNHHRNELTRRPGRGRGGHVSSIVIEPPHTEVRIILPVPVDPRTGRPLHG